MPERRHLLYQNLLLFFLVQKISLNYVNIYKTTNMFFEGISYKIYGNRYTFNNWIIVKNKINNNINPIMSIRHGN